MVTRGYDEAMRGLDLKITQLTMLAAVAIGRERATLSDLAENLGMDRSTFSRNLGPLERRGLVELSAEGRHRARTVRLTAAGGALLEEAVPRWRTAQEQLRARLGAETLDQLKTQLERVAGGV
ncbi:MAG: MarR family winged helix-turn-helix transcriptional regulator [Acidobacteriota bacterium]